MSTSKYKIRKGWEYRFIYRNGRRKSSRFFVLYYIKTNLGYSRFGISASKKLGGAVTRNRIKRLLREVIRLRDDVKDMSMDIVIVARDGMLDIDFQETNKAFGSLIKYVGT